MRRGVVLFMSLGVAACGGGGSATPSSAPTTTTPSPATLVFRSSVVDPAVLDFILPLGNLNPPGHTLPTDHIYFYVGLLQPANRSVPVFAPGNGTVQQVFNGAADAKVFVRVSATFTYYVDHVVLDGGIQPGTVLTAGQRLGTSGPNGFGVDLGVLNAARALFFINPARYSRDTLNADAPLQYYEEPLRSQLYGAVRRDGSEKDGRIDFDVAGRLQGNWFHESLAVAESALPSAWARHLAFVYDNVHPSERRISIGGTLPLVGTFAVDAAEPAFDAVTPDTGLVTYTLRIAGDLGSAPGPPAGRLLVQLLDASRVRVEVTGDGATGFGSAAQIYAR